jgi:hypothetical protein
MSEGVAMKQVGTFYGHLVYFKVIWYLLWPFGTFYGRLVYFPVLVCCTKKNLATLVPSICNRERSGLNCQHVSFDNEFLFLPSSVNRQNVKKWGSI